MGLFVFSTLRQSQKDAISTLSDTLLLWVLALWQEFNRVYAQGSRVSDRYGYTRILPETEDYSYFRVSIKLAFRTS